MGLFDRILVGLLPVLPRFLVWRVARRYVAGPALPDALAAVAALRAADVAATVSLLGEHAARRQAIQAALDEHLHLVDALAGVGGDVGLSVKPSLVGLDESEDRCAASLDVILQAADRQGLFVRLDMESHHAVEPTLRLHRRLAARYPRVGVVLQAYLHRTLADIAALPPGSNVRLCKGIYREPPAVAWQGYDTVRAAYVAALDKLLDAGHAVAVATHDEYLVQAGLAALDRHAATDRAEFQLLLGVQAPLRRLVQAQGHRVRVYVPYGRDWFAYSRRRLRENPAVARHVVRALFRPAPSGRA